MKTTGKTTLSIGKLQMMLMLLLMLPPGLYAQEQIGIKNDSLLYSFFSKIAGDSTDRKEVIRVVHIGDSHLQAGVMPDRIRKRLQQSFGNSGYGFTFPYSVANTKGTDLIEYTTNTKWQSQRIVFEDLGYPVGLSGIALFTDRPDFRLRLAVKDPEYSFSRIRIFTPDNRSDFSVSLNEGNDSVPVREQKDFHWAETDTLTSEIWLTAAGPQPQYALNGLILENKKPGLLYHSIGINGAKFIDYNKYSLFFDQLAALKPDLIIISLGTNGAFDKADYSLTDFENQMDEFLMNLKKRNISAPMLLTTPPPALRSGKDQNPKVPEFGADLIRRADLIGYSVWDLYRFLGGYENSDRLISEGLWADDRIHFTEKGYLLQADAFADALLSAYQKWVNQKD